VQSSLSYCGALASRTLTFCGEARHTVGDMAYNHVRATASTPLFDQRGPLTFVQSGTFRPCDFRDKKRRYFQRATSSTSSDLSPLSAAPHTQARTMGFFGLFGRTESDKRGDDIRAGTVAPSRAERQRCWEARDGYFACLDANNIVDALKEDKKAAKMCGKQSAQFEKDCATQWVCFPSCSTSNCSLFALLSCCRSPARGRPVDFSR